MSAAWFLGVLALTQATKSPVQEADGYIWVEGESAKTKECTPHGWYDSIKKGLLSGGDRASNYGPKDGLFEYDVVIPADGEYTFWIRANPIGAKLSYRLGGQAEWTAIDFRNATDTVNLAADDKPDMRFMAWVKVGRVPLKTGTMSISFKMHSDSQHHGALDCFVFTRKPFTPNGSVKPGQRLNLADPGRWSFEPGTEEFGPSDIDLRSLNEKVAGESGWVKATPDGDFALGSGQPVRFWAVNTDVYNRPIEELRTHARFLAKHGVNMVRFHGSLWPKGKNSKISEVDLAEIDKMQKCVSVMKQEGIYTTLSPYWAIPVEVQASWGIAGRTAGGNAPGLLFWDETLQAAYKGWIRELFTRKNPYDPQGTPLGKDAGVAIFQIQNEDSLLFWTLGSVKGEEAARLCRHFGAWLAKKYGSLEKASAAWQNAGGPHQGKDNLAAGEVGMYGLWEYGSNPGGGKGARLADQLQFLTETMKSFNQDIADLVKKDLKCPVLINAGNWQTANALTMLDAERYSYTANEVIGVNRYIGGAHENTVHPHEVGYLVGKGDFFEDQSTLLNPGKFLFNYKQVVGKPLIISESTWVPPVGYQSEGPFLVAAYSALSGVDIYYWFATGSVGYDSTIRKWQFANPSMLGGFPAASLLFRKAYVKKGEVALHEERRLQDIWDLKSAIFSESEGFDPNRHAGSIPAESNVKMGAPSLAYLVGPLEVVYGGDPAKSRAVDWSKYVDDSKKTVRSITGELTFDYGHGVCRVDAPKAQGVSGFLSGIPEHLLSAVKIESKNEYATVLVVPLDDRELRSSGKILVQVTTLCRPYGWRESTAEFQSQDKKRTFRGKRIDDTGSVPWNVVDTAVTVTIRNSGLKRATLLDENGYPVEELKGTTAGGGFTVKLPERAMYVVVQ
jgi:hypothetical protein